jgi:hypothetical protein
VGSHLSPYEQHPSQLGTGELREPPRLTWTRIVVGLVVAAVVIGVGYALRSDSSPILHCHAYCASTTRPVGSSISLLVWYGAGILLAGLVVAWPWIAQALRRRPNPR